jgi:hypothetical protein
MVQSLLTYITAGAYGVGDACNWKSMERTGAGGRSADHMVGWAARS